MGLAVDLCQNHAWYDEAINDFINTITKLAHLAVYKFDHITRYQMKSIHVDVLLYVHYIFLFLTEYRTSEMPAVGTV